MQRGGLGHLRPSFPRITLSVQLPAAEVQCNVRQLLLLLVLQQSPVGLEETLNWLANFSAELNRRDSLTQLRLAARLNSRERNPAEKHGTLCHLRGNDPRMTQGIYTHVASEDSRKVAAQLGDSVWGILDANGRKKGNGSGVQAPKPFRIN